jgi:hypothetical protein
MTVLSETPIAAAIAGCDIPLSRNNTIWMRCRCASGIFERNADCNGRICSFVYLIICPPRISSAHREGITKANRPAASSYLSCSINPDWSWYEFPWAAAHPDG